MLYVILMIFVFGIVLPVISGIIHLVCIKWWDGYSYLGVYNPKNPETLNLSHEFMSVACWYPGYLVIMFLYILHSVLERINNICVWFIKIGDKTDKKD